LNTKQIHRFVHRYLEATNCSILEKSPYHFTVKLSPAADRELTNRPYYWGFIDRLNETPETMSFQFITDPDKYEEAIVELPPAPAPASAEQKQADAVLERAYGVIPKPIARVPKEHLHYGSSRLDQLFSSTKNNGSYVYLFQEPNARGLDPFSSHPYTVWLGINYLIEYCCDRKREEIHSLGISLVTGHCVENFHQKLESYRFTPRIPPNMHITKNGITYNRALTIAEQTIERKLKAYDFTWAEAAQQRLSDELARMKTYYMPMIKNAEPEQEVALTEQFAKREEEIRWQYEPRITATVINCGLFHLEGID